MSKSALAQQHFLSMNIKTYLQRTIVSRLKSDIKGKVGTAHNDRPTALWDIPEVGKSAGLSDDEGTVVYLTSLCTGSTTLYGEAVAGLPSRLDKLACSTLVDRGCGGEGEERKESEE